MKVTIEVDCSPEEARRFIGLPDVAPVHEAMVQQMKTAAENAAPYFDPETLAKLWMPSGGEAFQEFQRAMWDAVAGKKSG
jgi:hypothetical protein